MFRARMLYFGYKTVTRLLIWTEIGPEAARAILQEILMYVTVFSCIGNTVMVFFELSFCQLMFLLSTSSLAICFCIIDCNSRIILILVCHYKKLKSK